MTLAIYLIPDVERFLKPWVYSPWGRALRLNPATGG